MCKLKIIALLGALVAGTVFSIAIQAYPMPGSNQEVYVTYYSNASYTTEVGVRGVSHDSNCAAWHATWGSTSQYSRVTVENCYTNGGGEP